MNKLNLAFVFPLGILLSCTKTLGRQGNMNLVKKSIYEYSFKRLNGETVSMQDFKGKYILIVNVASRCGYTKQYKSLQSLYEKYQDKLEIIGFPCNQFGWQEPGTSSEIQSFCETTYGVTFTMANKVDVKGDKQDPIYQFLTNQVVNGKKDISVSWNFNKFLVSPEGDWLAHFNSGIQPESDKITSFLQ
ncbi:MAG: Hydroperoxy fatty acid reductase gpx1 [Bacteroidetes bacterium MED-G17]|nr:MAG: Hydroperoxy fatty acid reductase gpx1 [Bacteroidetes bacterium MED-G17]